MLTPEEIHNKVFDRAVISGYVTTDVDAFLEQVEEDYSTLVRDNTTLRSKNRALMKMVEEYRSTEDSMRMAFANTKKTNEELINETKAKCAALTKETEDKCSAMLKDAQSKRDAVARETEEKYRAMADAANAKYKAKAEELNNKLKELERQVSFEERRLASACADTDRYIAAIRRLTERQEEYLTGLREMTEAARPKNVPKPQPPAPKKKIDEIQIEPDLDSLDETDTATAEEITDVVAKVMHDMNKAESETAEIPPEKKLGKRRAKNKEQA